MEKILRRVLDEGNFGKERSFYKKRGTKYLVKKAVALLSYFGRSFSIAFLFPRHTAQYFFSHIYNGFATVFGDIKVKFKSGRHGR